MSNSAQLRKTQEQLLAIPQSCSQFRKVARNSAQLRATELRLETLIKTAQNRQFHLINYDYFHFLINFLNLKTFSLTIITVNR